MIHLSTRIHHWLTTRTDERGWSISIEQLLWIIGIIVMVGVVLGVLNGYIDGKLGELQRGG